MKIIIALSAAGLNLPKNHPVYSILKDWHDQITAGNPDYLFQPLDREVVESGLYHLYEKASQQIKDKFDWDVPKINWNTVFKEKYGKTPEQLSNEIDEKNTSKIFNTAELKKLRKLFNRALFPAADWSTLQNGSFYVRKRGKTETLVYVTADRNSGTLDDSWFDDGYIKNFNGIQDVIEFLKAQGVKETKAPKAKRRLRSTGPLYD
jgi:hypothetical protein